MLCCVAPASVAKGRVTDSTCEGFRRLRRRRAFLILGLGARRVRTLRTLERDARLQYAVGHLPLLALYSLCDV